MGFYGINISNTDDKTTSYTSALSSQRSYSPYNTNIFDESKKTKDEEKDFMELLLEQQNLIMELAFNTMPNNVHRSNYKLDGSFESALNVILNFEGGYVNDKDDRGGATNFGITQSTYNSWCKQNGQRPKNVRNITKEEVKEIYYKDYWLASGADKIKDPKMALLVFDTAVLHGVGGAKKLYDKSGGNYDKLLQARRDRYKEIVDSNPSQKKFHRGWMNRVDMLA